MIWFDLLYSRQFYKTCFLIFLSSLANFVDSQKVSAGGNFGQLIHGLISFLIISVFN